MNFLLDVILQSPERPVDFCNWRVSPIVIFLIIIVYRSRHSLGGVHRGGENCA